MVVLMFLTNLTLTAFRSYDHTQLELAPGCVVLTGQNAAGKTNVMEEISLLAGAGTAGGGEACPFSPREKG